MGDRVGGSVTVGVGEVKLTVEVGGARGWSGGRGGGVTENVGVEQRDRDIVRLSLCCSSDSFSSIEPRLYVCMGAFFVLMMCLVSGL